MDASIRVNTGEKKVEVNDNGDYITLKLGDTAFTNTLTQLIKDTHKIAVDFDNTELGDNPEEVAAFTEKSAEICSDVMNRIDALFGDETCKKVFGERIPDFTAFTEFFSQIAVLVKKFEGERINESAKRLEKYTAKYAVKHGNA